jgi:signal recognition particle GTPase
MLNSYILTKKVLEIINRLLNRKVVELDRILNKILKRITLEISASLVQRIYTALIYSLLPAHYKKSITIVLYKKSKKNYLLSKSYRLITLKNTLIKIIKKVLITYLSCITEKHSLLL